MLWTKLAYTEILTYPKIMNLTPIPKAVLPKIPFVIGIDKAGNEIKLENKNRFGNSLILGGAGSGKTNLMLNMILQDINCGNGVCFFDVMGETTDLIISKIPENKKDKVLLLTPDLDYDTLDLDSAIKEDKIILVQALLGRDGIEKTKKFNRGLSNQLIKAIEKRNTTIFNTRPFFIYIDEFQYLVSDKVIELIQNSQKHNVSFVLAYQFLTQLDKHDKETKIVILENTKSKYIFNCSNEDKELLKSDFAELEYETFKCSAKINNFDKVLVLGCEEVK